MYRATRFQWSAETISETFNDQRRESPASHQTEPTHRTTVSITDERNRGTAHVKFREAAIRPAIIHCSSASSPCRTPTQNGHRRWSNYISTQQLKSTGSRFMPDSLGGSMCKEINKHPEVLYSRHKTATSVIRGSSTAEAVSPRTSNAHVSHAPEYMQIISRVR